MTLASLLLAAAASAWAVPPEWERSVVLQMGPRRLWTADALPAPGQKLTLTYGFLDGASGGRAYRSCPDASRALPGARYPSCERFQQAVVAALTRWAEASGRLELRRAAQGEAPRVVIAWTDLPDGNIGLVTRDTPDPTNGQDGAIAASYGGFARPQMPDYSRRYAGLLFDAGRCWHLEDPSVCRPNPVKAGTTAEVLEAGGRVSLPRVALHEAGHVMGFHHFRAGPPTVMGMGGSGLDELQPLDLWAVRRLYELAFAPPRRR